MSLCMFVPHLHKKITRSRTNIYTWFMHTNIFRIQKNPHKPDPIFLFQTNASKASRKDTIQKMYRTQSINYTCIDLHVPIISGAILTPNSEATKKLKCPMRKLCLSHRWSMRLVGLRSLSWLGENRSWVQKKGGL